MLKQNEILFETTDLDLVKELLAQKNDGISIDIYQTRAAEYEPIARFFIEFLSDAGLVYFGHWLGTRHTKKGTDKTTINKREIPQNINNITIFIKQELERQQRDESQNNEEE